jgi:hypothetical protein
VHDSIVVNFNEEEIVMVTNKSRLLKVGAAAVLSVGLLSACGDDGDDDIIIDDPDNGEVDPNDGTDNDVDIDMDDTDDNPDEDVDTDDKE